MCTACRSKRCLRRASWDSVTMRCCGPTAPRSAASCRRSRSAQRRNDPQWPEGEAKPVKYWISNLPADIPAKDLVRLAKSRWRIEHDYRELKTRLGLDHFEGRSYIGWHRHVTLVSSAHLFLTEERALPKALAGA